MQYVDPQNPTARYTIGAGQVRLPNGDVLLSPLTAALAQAAGLVPLVEERPDLDADETLNGNTLVVEAERVVLRWSKRNKTAAELKAERQAALQQLEELTVMFVRLCEQLLADGVVRAGDFSAGLRQTFQQAQALVDQLDPDGA